MAPEPSYHSGSVATSPRLLTDPNQMTACAVCERTILLGEEPLRFTHQGRSRTVCRLCANQARGDGWVEEGRSAPPPVTAPRPGGVLRRLLASTAREPELDPADPVLAPRGLGTADDVARATTMVVGVEVFNASPYRGTITGIAKSLGQPRVGVVAFGGRRPGVAITIAWDLCWYRYLVEPGGSPAVRLDERGDSVGELAPRWREWNARTLPDGAIELDIRPDGRPEGAGER